MTEQEALGLHEQAQQLQAGGEHEKAIAAFSLVAAYFEESEGPQSPDLANILDDRAESLLELCRYADAGVDAKRALDIVEAVAPFLDPETRSLLLPRALGVWGRVLRETGRYEEAAEPLWRAVNEAHDPVEIATSLNNYGVLCKYWGKFEDGERSYTKALHIVEREFGVDSPQAATLFHNLGGLEHARGDYAKGEPLGRKAYEIRRKAFGEDDPRTIADAVAWGGLLDGLGRHDESVPIYRRALAYYEQRFGPEHFEVAATLNNLGMARGAQGDVAEATALLRRAVDIKRKLFGDDHPETRLTRGNLAKLLPGS